eukprot:scaffold11998_cov174-Amphora_coffeaeformis.AAC.2
MMWHRTNLKRCIGPVLLLAATRPCIRFSGWRSLVVSAESTITTASPNKYKTLKVQVIHRHGDRSPITPMKDLDFWSSQLIDDHTLGKIAENTEIIREEEFNHSAGARGPFGKLSKLGLLQMIRVGDTLSEELTKEKENGLFYTPLFPRERALHPSHMRVYSTDFSRTIQSVQGLLVGLYPDGIPGQVSIDVRNTVLMIPDPMPRRFKEQELLESMLVKRPHVVQKESDMLALAIKATTALHDMLGEGAHEVSFGVVQDSIESIEIEPLRWNQLAEITVCLDSRDMLPPPLTKEEKDEITHHTAWRWFQTLSNPRLIYLAMHDFVTKQMNVFKTAESEPFTVWSAHDSTLIALLCAYRLERPDVWPEYASYIVMELVEQIDSKERFVRFSINGQRLQSQWEDAPAYDMIPLSVLLEKVETVGAQPSEFAEIE